MSTTQTELQDPQEQQPKPDYPQQPTTPPGLEAEMTPTADHGEQTYIGSDQLRDRVALITGADSGIGRAGQPAELAPVYVPLASNTGSYITGQIYGVTGDPLI